MALAQKQTGRPMDQNRRPNKGAKTHNGEKAASSANVTGKTG
jgi:hypothetical protein